MAARKTSSLGAATDDAKALVNRAIREAHQAIHDKDQVGLRQAAEKGWLAASAAADVAAVRLGQKMPRGFTGRLHALQDLEKEARLRSGTLTKPLEVAKSVLHGDCFHGDSCPTPATLLSLLEEDITGLVNDSQKALAKKRAR